MSFSSPHCAAARAPIRPFGTSSAPDTPSRHASRVPCARLFSHPAWLQSALAPLCSQPAQQSVLPLPRASAASPPPASGAWPPDWPLPCQGCPGSPLGRGPGARTPARRCAHRACDRSHRSAWHAPSGCACPSRPSPSARRGPPRCAACAQSASAPRACASRSAPLRRPCGCARAYGQRSKPASPRASRPPPAVSLAPHK
mmetsp:Transcript_55325/g.161475  ORF Transcript_55325/g.161475 Transcript_55325/m.161475 type:complete len:200 (+) Transcript_55325:913-1512(+)